MEMSLQLFHDSGVFTNEGKGWGLRTLDGLPKGAFICELVGEVLTSSELHERKAKNSKHVDQVLLDASWGSEGLLRDEEALCLDLAYYGNVGRLSTIGMLGLFPHLFIYKGLSSLVY